MKLKFALGEVLPSLHSMPWEPFGAPISVSAGGDRKAPHCMHGNTKRLGPCIRGSHVWIDSFHRLQAPTSLGMEVRMSMQCALMTRIQIATQERFGAVEDLQAQHAGLPHERNGLHQSVERLSQQLKSRVATTELQEAQSEAEIKRLTTQLALQQEAQQSARHELESVVEQLKGAEGKHAAVVRERDSLHVHVLGLEVALDSKSAHAGSLSEEKWQLSRQLALQREAQESARHELQSVVEQLKGAEERHAAVVRERDGLQIHVLGLNEQLKSWAAHTGLQEAGLGTQIQQLRMELQQAAKVQAEVLDNAHQYMQLQGTQQDALAENHAHQADTVIPTLGADHSAADEAPGADGDTEDASDGKDMGPADEYTGQFAALRRESEAKAEAAWNRLKACMGAMHVRWRQHRPAGPERQWPLLATLLLESHQLSAEIMARAAWVAANHRLLRKVQACPGWDSAMQHDRHLQKNIDDLLDQVDRERHEKRWPWAPEPDLDLLVATLAEWPGGESKLRQVLEQQYGKKTKLSWHVDNVLGTIRAVSHALKNEMQRNDLGPASRCALMRWCNHSDRYMLDFKDASACDAAKRKAALCNKMVAYCTAMYLSKASAFNTLQGHVPAPQKLADAHASSGPPELAIGLAAKSNVAGSAAVSTATTAAASVESQAASSDDAEPSQAAAGASKTRPEATSTGVAAGPTDTCDLSAEAKQYNMKEPELVSCHSPNRVLFTGPCTSQTRSLHWILGPNLPRPSGLGSIRHSHIS